MGRRGPPPEPTALKKLKGNPGRRPLNDSEPQPTPGIPKPTEPLDDVAQRRWDEAVAELGPSGVLTLADGAALTMYCLTYSKWVQACDDIEVYGQYQTNLKTGVTSKHPSVLLEKEYREGAARLGALFGLTPSDRSRLKVEKDAGEDAFAKAAFGKREPKGKPDLKAVK